MGFGGSPPAVAGPSGPELGTSIGYVSAAGVSNDVTPAGFGAGVGAIIVTSGAADATWTGLAAGSEGQTVRITYTDTATLTFKNLNAGSAAANRFQGFGDQTIRQGMSVMLQYRGALNGGAGAWGMA